jgi:hypothetical protein
MDSESSNILAAIPPSKRGEAHVIRTPVRLKREQKGYKFL